MTAVSVTEFLLARLREDEAKADSVHGDLCAHVASDWMQSCDCPWPARIRVEAVAKRGVVQCHEGWHECAYSRDNGTVRGLTDFDASGADSGLRPCQTLLALAAVHSDHPEYDKAWML